MIVEYEFCKYFNDEYPLSTLIFWLRTINDLILNYYNDQYMILTYSNNKNIIIAFDHKIKKANVKITDVFNRCIEDIVFRNTDFERINIDEDVETVFLEIKVDGEIIKRKIII